MKKRSFLTTAAIFALLTGSSLIAFISCNNSSGSGGSGGDGKTLSVSNAQFDSVSRALTAKVAAEDGVEVSLTCNNQTETAIASDGQISLTLVTPFHAGVNGGKTYSFAVSADDYSGTQMQLSYWPLVEAELSCNDEEYVYTGGASDIAEPVLAIRNYEESSVTTAISFKAEVSGEMTAMSDWTFDDLRAWCADEANVGKSAEMHFTVTPNLSSGAADLAASGYVTYHVKSDTLAQSAHIVKDGWWYEARLFAESEDEITSVAETAGGVTAYQWQVSSDAESFTDITGATGKTFSLAASNVESYLDKTLRVKITQTIDDVEQESIYSTTYPVYYTVRSSNLYYDGMLLSGDTFDTAKIRGTLTDNFGNTYSADTFIWDEISEISEQGGYIADFSRSFLVACTHVNFYDSALNVFANVRAVLSEEDIPELSEDTDAIELGKADFEEIDSSLEVSFNGGATYEDFPEEAFAVSEGSMLHVRAKASGTPATSGYVRESSPRVLTVTAGNVGKNVSGTGLIEDLEMLELALKKKTSKGVTTITPVLNYTISGCAYEYTWLIDGADSALYSGVSENAKHALVIDNSSFGKDAYQIFCMVRLYVPADDEDDETELACVSSQISLSIK